MVFSLLQGKNVRARKIRLVLRVWASGTQFVKPCCFSQNCFLSFKFETACDRWKMANLQRKRNLSILSSNKKAVEIPENETGIVSDRTDDVAVVYDGKFYIDKVLLMLKYHLINMLELYQ